MKISKLIELLKEIEESYGDIPVFSEHGVTNSVGNISIPKTSSLDESDISVENIFFLGSLDDSKRTLSNSHTIADGHFSVDQSSIETGLVIHQKN